MRSISRTDFWWLLVIFFAIVSAAAIAYVVVKTELSLFEIAICCAFTVIVLCGRGRKR
jgi:hypothetical protein